MSQVPIVQHDFEYRELLGKILNHGQLAPDRTGTGTISVFGGRMEFDLKHRFPLLTGKTVHWKSVVEELLWFMRGDTNVNDLNATIWDEWAGEDGECGPIYGFQWRSWPAYRVEGSGRREWIDQLATVVNTIRKNPHSRRHIVSAWNVAQLDEMALPPCHLLFQFYVSAGGYLDCQLYQRSCDMFLGVPFNIASYSLLTHVIAYMTHLKPGRFIWVGGDCHVYTNHLDACQTYLDRVPPTSPILRVSPQHWRSLDDWEFADFHLTEYEPCGIIKAKVAV